MGNRRAEKPSRNGEAYQGLATQEAARPLRQKDKGKK